MIAREGRLTRSGAERSSRVYLSPLDESVLSLVDRAIKAGKDLTLVYPAPAGDVCVLLAAQILLLAFLNGQQLPAVGVLTGDPAGSTRTWNELRIAAPGSRTPLSEVFPCWRCAPDGTPQLGRKRARGVVVGNRFRDWAVDEVVVDHLAGQVEDEIPLTAIHVFADPLDPAISQLASRGSLVWGWSPGELSAWLAGAPLSGGNRGSVFSIGEQRLRTLAAGVDVTIGVAHDQEAEQSIRRLRDDLKTLADLAASGPSQTIDRGIRVAWHHVSTLASLPCRPSDFDRFAGIPPIAARPTNSFEPEIAAWARVLTGDARDIAGVIASDLGDLRARLETSPPFLTELAGVLKDETPTLVVVRTHTAARGLLSAVGIESTGDGSVGNSAIRSVGRLHREGAWPRAVIVGTPPRWEWHKIDSGLSARVRVLVLGDVDARMGVSVLHEIDEARRHWGSPSIRAQTWKQLIGGRVPDTPPEVTRRYEIKVEGLREAPPEVDPFAELEKVLVGGQLTVGQEGVEEGVAEEIEEGKWAAAVEAVEVETDAGVIRLPSARLVDVRIDDKIVDCRAQDLRAGMFLLIGRKAGRVGLLDALAERLKDRPDLFAATLLVTDLQSNVRRAFQTSRITITQLYERMREAGFSKTYAAARGYVGEGGPLAPRDIEDLRRLNAVLKIGFDDVRIREVFAGVSRLRNFRRAAGRALAAAARGATVAESNAVDPETGLSVADLRDVVLEAEVIRVTSCPELVPMAELDRLEAKE
jgi:hypothetical protein